MKRKSKLYAPPAVAAAWAIGVGFGCDPPLIMSLTVLLTAVALATHEIVRRYHGAHK